MGEMKKPGRYVLAFWQVGVMGTSYYVDGVEVTSDVFYDAAGVENSSELAYKARGYYQKKSRWVPQPRGYKTNIDSEWDIIPELIEVEATPLVEETYWEWVDVGSAITNASTAVMGFAQTAMLDARRALNMHSKINAGSFRDFMRTYGRLGFAGKALRGLGYGVAAVSLISDYSAMQSGEMSSGEFAYNTTGTTVSIIGGIAVTTMYGTLPGAAVSTLIGGSFFVGKMFYHGFNRVVSDVAKFQNNLQWYYPGYGY